MAPKNQVRLEAVAEIQKARDEILELVAVVNQLAAAVGKTTDKKFEVVTEQSLQKLADLEAGLVAVGDASEASTEKVKKSSTKGAESVEKAADRQTKAIQKAFDAVEKELAATEKAVAAKERAQAKLDKATAQKERNAQRSIDADKRALAALLSSTTKELDAEDRKVQRIIASINKKEAARDREKNRQALRIAQKIEDEKKESAAADATAARIVAAERRKAEALLQSEAASKRHMGQLLSSAAAQDKFAISAQTAARSIQAFFASIVLNKLKDFLVEITEVGAAFEQYKILLETATGSNAAAGETFNSLKGFADTFGLSLETLIQRFPRFAIAAKDSGLELDQVRTVFDAFAIANRAVGNSTEQTQRVFVALEQIFNKGVVQAEELKQQLGDSLPAAYNAMAKAIGVTTKELVVLLKENKVLANEALPALAAELLKTLGPGVLKNVTSVRAEIERMKNSIFLAKVEIAESAKPELLEMLRVIKDIGENGTLNFDAIGESVGALYTGLSRVVTLLNNIASFNLEGLGAQILQLVSLVTQGVGEIVLGINILLTKIPGIPESMREGAKEAMRAWNQAHEDIRSGFDDVANSGVNSASAIGDAVNVQGRRAIDGLRKAQAEALKIAEEQKAKAAEKEEAITEKEQEELDKRVEAERTAADERIKIQDALVASLEGDAKARAESTANLIFAIETVERHGEVTEQESAKIQAALQKELDLYAEYGIAPPQSLQVLIDKYEVLSTAQEKAIDAQKKRLAELQAEIKKTADDLAALEAKLAGPDRDIFGNALDETGKSVEDLKKELEGLTEQPRKTVDDLQKIDDLNKKLSDARRKSKGFEFGKVDDAVLDDLDALFAARDKLNEAQREAAFIEGDLARAQAGAAGASDKAQEATKSYEQTVLDNLDALRAQRDAIHEQALEFDDAGQAIDDASGAAGEFGDGLKELANDGSDAAESVGGIGDAARDAAESVGEVRDAAGEIGSGFDKANDSVAKMPESLEETLSVVEKIEASSSRILSLWQQIKQCVAETAG